MSPEHWQQVDRLFHAALGYESEQRGAFLTQACEGDDSLRREVESLLSAHEQPKSFIERPAADVATELLRKSQAALVGRTIGNYRIEDLLGAGGMGEVYLARDTRLGRKVALKLLPVEFTSDTERVRRFQQEAYAASALNHPNIITIYEIGQVEDRRFIATEFIDGETLRQHFMRAEPRISKDASRTSGMSLNDALNIAIQTADALAAAHEAGVVHRDIKPENIMLRKRDAYVKVLDFGLAKLTAGSGISFGTGAPTNAQFRTSAGMVMGTPSYMSPEQARGDKVDARTDIWSLGVVLYEMVAGCPPFERPTPSEIIAFILEREPPPLGRYAREVPPELERIVGKALTKNKEQRYQSAKDLLTDLRRLRQQFDNEKEMIGSRANSAVMVAEPKAVDSGITVSESGPTANAKVAHQTLSAPFFSHWSKRHKQAAVLVLTITGLALAGIALFKYQFVRHQPAKLAPFQAIKIQKLTTTGNAIAQDISPDGKYVAYLVDAEDKQSLWVRQVASSSEIELVASAVVHYLLGGMTFSRDGNYIYYVTQDDAINTLYRVPVLSGPPRKVLADILSHVAVSPDDKRLAFTRCDHKNATFLIVANTDGSGEQVLTSRLGGDWFRFSPGAGPAWSPDGNVIVCGGGSLPKTAGPTAIEGRNDTLLAVQVKDGSQTEFTSGWDEVLRLAWVGDGSGLVAELADKEKDLRHQLWYVSYPAGEAHRITNDFHGYMNFGMTENSSTIVSTQSEQTTNIWVASIANNKPASQITFSNDAGWRGASWTPEGRIVYYSEANNNLWIMDGNGSNQRQLTLSGGPNIKINPSVTGDGRHVVFLGWDTIWRIDIDGSGLKPLVRGNVDSPTCSPDGRWVVYVNDPGTTLWKLPIDGGGPVKLFEHAISPTVSPDGKWIACLYLGTSYSTARIAIVPVDGGSPLKLLDLPRSDSMMPNILRWSPDGGAITYVHRSGGVDNIWRQPVDGGPSKQLTDFKSDHIFSYDLSHDGKLACARGIEVNNIVLITDSTPGRGF